MKVSVIMPVYNTEHYLRKSVGSLLNQTLDGVEIVAVDDGSTDSCPEILDQLQKEHPEQLKVFHKKNGGQASARNLALSHCTGEYIGFLDSDDTVDRDMFQVLYEKAKSTNADYVACGYRDTTWENEKEIVLKDYVASQSAESPKDLFFGALVSPFLHLYRAEVLLTSGVFFPEGFIYEDTAFYLNLIPYLQRIETVERAMASRVRHSHSTMTIVQKEKVAQIMPVLENTIGYYQSHGFDKIFGKELEYFCVRVLLCSSMGRIAKVSSRKDGWDLVSMTLEFIRNYFPNYRKNPYFHQGILSAYLRSFNGLTAHIYYPLFRLKAKRERRFE